MRVEATPQDLMRMIFTIGQLKDEKKHLECYYSVRMFKDYLPKN